MEHYSFLRTLADSWGVVALLVVFLGVCVWDLRPGSRPLHDDAANSIFRNDDTHPAQAVQPTRAESNRPQSNRKEA